MIIFSDVHLKDATEDVVFREVLPGLREACSNSVPGNSGMREAVCLGDFFHIRYKIDARIQNLVADEFRKWASLGIWLRILPGNHDQYDVDGRNVLELFSEIDGVDVYSESVIDPDGVWVPFRKDPNSILGAVAALPNTVNAKGKRVLWLHHGVRGAWTNEHVQNQDGVDPKKLEEFDHIFCGHYHGRQTVGRVQFVGSTYQTRADESGQEKGYFVFDGAKAHPITTNWGPKYHRIELDGSEPVDFSGIGVNDDVRVTTKGADATALATKAGGLLHSMGVRKHIVTPEVVLSEARLEVDDNSVLRDYAAAYVAKFGGELNHGMLLDLFGRLAG